MLSVYSAILSYSDEPKHLYSVCSLFRDIMSKKSFWKERHNREGLPFVECGDCYLRTYYQVREFMSQETPLSCHLSELPFFPSFAKGEEYYPRAIKFRREQVPQPINIILLEKCAYHSSRGYEGWSLVYDYRTHKASNDEAVKFFEIAMDVKDPDHPSLDVSIRLQRTESCKAKPLSSMYSFYLYLDLRKAEEKVEVFVEATLIGLEQALSFYLQVKNQH